MEINSSVTRSPKFAIIMDNYDKYGRKMPVKSFWKKYVEPEDSSISYLVWMRYMKKIDPAKRVKVFAMVDPTIPAAEDIPEPPSDDLISEDKPETPANSIIISPTNPPAPITTDKTHNQLEESSLKNIFAISERTLDDLVTHPELLIAVPVKERMKWLFAAMKARDSRMVALTKVNAEKRKTTMYEDMLQSAQYGEIEESEFDEIDEETAPKLEKPKSEPIPEPIKTDKIVSFDPNNL